MSDTVRQSVTMPRQLARKIARDAKKRRESFSRAALRYIEAGITEEERARRRVRALVRKIQAAATPEEADRLYGEEFMETIFGPQEARAQD